MLLISENLAYFLKNVPIDFGKSPSFSQKAPGIYPEKVYFLLKQALHIFLRLVNEG